MSLDVNNSQSYLSPDLDESDTSEVVQVLHEADTELQTENELVASENVDDTQINLGKMEYHGILSGSISYHGKSPELLRKCLDLSILRCDVETSRWCVLELDRFKLVKGEPLRTNLVNRLVYCIPRYVGNSIPTLIIQVNKLVEQWDQVRKLSGSMDRQLLLQVLQLLLDAPRQTVITEYAKVYHEILSYPDLMGHPVYTESCPDYDTFPETAHGCWEYAQESDPPELICLMDGLVYQFQAKSKSVYYWLLQIVELGNQKIRASQRYRRYRPEYAVWEYLFTLDLPEISTQVLSILFSWYRSRLDPSLYLIQAIDLLLSGNINGDTDTKLSSKITDLSPSISESDLYETKALTTTLDVREYINTHRDYRPTNASVYQEILDLLLAKQTAKRSGSRKSTRKKKAPNFVETEELVADIPPIED